MTQQALQEKPFRIRLRGDSHAVHHRRKDTAHHLIYMARYRKLSCSQDPRGLSAHPSRQSRSGVSLRICRAYQIHQNALS